MCTVLGVIYLLSLFRLKRFKLPCQVQRAEVSVVHTVDRVLHCTLHTGHPNYNLLGPSQQALDFSTCRICCFGNRKNPTPGFLWL